MAIEAQQLGRAVTRGGEPAATLEAFAAATRVLAEGPSLVDALDAIVRATAAATGAEVVVVRVLDPDGRRASVRTVHTGSAALAAELEGSRVELDTLPAAEVDENGELPEGLRWTVERLGGEAALYVPVVVRGRLVGSLELVSGASFGPTERLIARLAADQIGAAVRAFEGDGAGGDGDGPGGRVLELAGEALAAGADRRAPEEIVRIAAECAGARAATLWRRDREGGALEVAASFGEVQDDDGSAHRLAEAALDGTQGVVSEEIDGAVVVTLGLGRPAAAALQLVYDPEAAPGPGDVGRLAIFGVRAAHALRAVERSRTLEVELERTRALLAAVAQANEELSLAHTLSTVVGRVAELLETDRIAVYLREEGRLVSAAERALEGRHEPVAERLLALALGPFRGRGMVVVDDAAGDTRLYGVESALASAKIEAAIAVPLLVPGDVVGLLAVYPERGRMLTENESTLVAALAAQLSVAVQNARLHERATRLTAERERDLIELQSKEENLRALYEISRSFAHDLSLEATLNALARTVVELLGVDAAVIRMPDGRGEQLVPRALHVADVRLEEALRPVLLRSQPLENLVGRRLLRARRPLVLDPALAARLPGYALLVPFLEKGSTAVVLPIATPAELLGTLSLVSLDPARPLTTATTDLALSVAGQAALALDNARLYQQQKEFSDTMQRSLLPRAKPQLPGIEVGTIYESSARVDVGGDVYDFMTLPDGRLAVVLGDVTGHGIDAAADMAMAKFVFRCLAREHPEPAAFLAAANEIVCGEIAPGKFITMLYLTLDPKRGELRSASAGHPAPRIVSPDGTVRPLTARGLVLGIDAGQEYEELVEQLPRGATVFLYTDGLVEARRGGELYGTERLDRALTEHRKLPADELAVAVMEECRAWSDGELADDCALVVIKRTGK